MKTYHFKNPYIQCRVIISMGRYTNKRTSLSLFDSEDFSPVAVATVNILQENLKENEIIVKDYSENEGMLSFLQKNNIVGEPKKWIEIGYVKCPVVDLLITDFN